jgi:hypothetical protein
MSLAIYDEDQSLLGSSSPVRSIHNGHLGGACEKLLYVRNDDPANYYTGLHVGIVSDVYDAAGESGDSGWSFKFMYGERRPTEAEWDVVRSGEAVALPDIGSTAASDMHTYHPIWLRVFVPGDTGAQYRPNYTVKIKGITKKVGA